MSAEGSTLPHAFEVCCPSNGRIVKIARSTDEYRFALIRIFLSPLDAHTVLAPVSASVLDVMSSRGLRIPAFVPYAARYNARVIVTLAAGGIQITVRVIAGLLTHRLHSFVSPNDIIAALTPIVEIRWGSLVEVSGPIQLCDALRQGRRVRAGQPIGLVRA